MMLGQEKRLSRALPTPGLQPRRATGHGFQQTLGQPSRSNRQLIWRPLYQYLSSSLGIAPTNAPRLTPRSRAGVRVRASIALPRCRALGCVARLYSRQCWYQQVETFNDQRPTRRLLRLSEAKRRRAKHVCGRETFHIHSIANNLGLAAGRPSAASLPDGSTRYAPATRRNVQRIKVNDRIGETDSCRYPSRNPHRPRAFCPGVPPRIHPETHSVRLCNQRVCWCSDALRKAPGKQQSCRHLSFGQAGTGVVDGEA